MIHTLKLEYIAQEVGVSQSHVSLILRGLRNANWQVAKKLGRLTNSDPIIWLDIEAGNIEKRKIALLRAELSIWEAKLVA